MTPQKIRLLGIYLILLLVGVSWAEESLNEDQPSENFSEELEKMIESLKQYKYQFLLRLNQLKESENNQDENSNLNEKEIIDQQKKEVSYKLEKTHQYLKEAENLKNRVDRPKNFREMEDEKLLLSVQELIQENELHKRNNRDPLDDLQKLLNSGEEGIEYSTFFSDIFFLRIQLTNVYIRIIELELDQAGFVSKERFP